MIDCAVIIVAYRSADDLPGLLRSLPDAAGPLSWHAVVVDNYGLDDLESVLADQERVTLIRSGGNLGYSGALNLGRGHTPPARFTAFLNPDLVLEPGALVALVDACTAPGVAAAVPRVLDEAGVLRPSLRREPTLSRALGEALLGDLLPRRGARTSEMVRDPHRYTTGGSVDWATGAALLVRTGVLGEVGDWDAARFFLYSEETDYFRRIRAAGYEIRFAPDAVVRHRGAGSGTSSQLEALMALNKLRYYRKWHGPVPSAAFFVVSVVHNLLRAGRPGARQSLKALFFRSARAALPGGEPKNPSI